MNKEQFINLISSTLSNEIIQKYIKGEINLTKSQLRKVVESEKQKRNKRKH